MNGSPSESDIVLAALQDYTESDNPSAFLALNSGNRYFHAEGIPGVIVYREAGRYLVQFAGPFAAPGDRGKLLNAFVAFAAERDREVVAVQIQAADAPDYVAGGFTVNQMGASFAVDLTRFSLRGTAFMQLRNKISRAHRTGLVAREAPLADWYERMQALDAAWLGSKGAGAKPLEFLVGQYGDRHQSLRRLFVAAIGDRLMGYITYSPVYGAHQGWLHDLTRRQPEAPPGTMEAINRAAIDTFIAEGVHWLHFGFTPFTELERLPRFGDHSRAFHQFMRYLWQHGEAVYPAQTQLAYKQKWAPSHITGEYIGFQHGASIPALVAIFRACNAV